MKYIKFIILIVIVFSSCDNNNKKTTQSFPAFELIKTFSKNIQPETSLILRCYGMNHNLPKNYQFKNRVANLSADYALYKTQKDKISLEHARKLIICLTESLLREINMNDEVLADLETKPFTHDLLEIVIYFQDANKVDLGSGVSGVYFMNGKIKYERYEIYEYTDRYPAYGNHFTIHEETYEEALDIVKRQGSLVYF